MTLSKRQLLTLILLLAILFLLPVAIFVAQKRQEIRKKASESIESSKLSLVGPNQVKVGEKFSVNILLDTTNDPNFTISGVDAVVSVNPAEVVPTCQLRACPAYDLPPNFCEGGQIVYPKPVDSCSCPPFPKCIRPQTGPTIPPELQELTMEEALALDYERQAVVINDPIKQMMPPIYRNRKRPIVLTNVSPGKIFDNYPLYPAIGWNTYGWETSLGEQGGTSVVGTPATAASSSSSGFRLMDVLCTDDAKQCSDGSYVGRTGPNCEFATCNASDTTATPSATPGLTPPVGSKPLGPPDTDIPIGASMPPSDYWKPPIPENLTYFTISGVKNYMVDSQGYFNGFSGNGTFATLNFEARYPGKVEIKLVYSGSTDSSDSNINGYLKNQLASAQRPQERLLIPPQALNIEVVEDNSCVQRPACLDDNPPCAVSPLAPGQTYCPTPTPSGCYYQQVQCFTEPCEPILVCPTTIPGPTCTPLPDCYGQPGCISLPYIPSGGWCPVTTLTPTCMPQPKCMTEGEVQSNGSIMRCVVDLLPGGWFCPNTTPTPTTTPSPSLSCNYSVNPQITCPEGYECQQTSNLIGASGICVKTTPTTACVSEGGKCGFGLSGQGACCFGLSCKGVLESYPPQSICVREEVPTSGPTETTCDNSTGDADCNTKVDLADFELWRKEFTGEQKTKKANFSKSGKASLADFEIWRNRFFKSGNP